MIVSLKTSKIIAIEGAVCGGKTVLSRGLTANLSAVRLPEYMELLPLEHLAHGQILPPRQRFELFLSLDKYRLSNCQGCALYIFDRSILSIIAFEYSLQMMGHEVLELAGLLEYSKEAQSYVPDLVVTLNVEPSVQAQRWAARGNPMDSIFISPVFNQYFLSALLRMAALFGSYWIHATSLHPDNAARLIADSIAAIPIAHNRISYGHLIDAAFNHK